MEGAATSRAMDVSRETGCTDVSRETQEDSRSDAVRRAACLIFGDRLPLAERYAQLLATEAVDRGLIGPRESGRLWERHLLNSAVVAELLRMNARVCDVGSGAGLPGIPLAIARPDLQVELVEPLLRRATFLTAAVSELGLDDVEITRARAEHLAGARRADVVTARAVAAVPKLAAWCLPLLGPQGSLLALKGARAGEELAAAGTELRRMGAQEWDVVTCGAEVLPEPTTVVRVVMGSQLPVPAPPRHQSRRGAP